MKQNGQVGGGETKMWEVPLGPQGNFPPPKKFHLPSAVPKVLKIRKLEIRRNTL